MSQTESDRFNAWWRSDERDIYPSKMHAWVVWLAATEAGRERIAKLETENMCAMELEAENERMRRGMSQLCREFREAAQEDAEEGGAIAAAYSYYADRVDVLIEATYERGAEMSGFDQRESADRLLAVRRLLEDNGCDCDCDHHMGEHSADCEVCLACRIEKVIAA
jgi:hypothetical protein